MTTVIGIDPGASGGIAWNGQGCGVQACGIPKTETERIELLRMILAKNQGSRIVGYMELVSGYVRPADKEEEDRVNRQPAHQMFQFGRGVGLFVGAMLMAGIAIHEVPPRTWQKPLFLNLKGRSRVERKRILKDAAQRKFPQLQVTLRTADALLIHAYGMLIEDQELLPVSGSNGVMPIPFTETHAAQFEGLKQEVEAVPGDAANLFIKDVHGRPWVCKHAIGRGIIGLHKATPIDIKTLPRA